MNKKILAIRIAALAIFTIFCVSIGIILIGSALKPSKTENALEIALDSKASKVSVTSSSTLPSLQPEVNTNQNVLTAKNENSLETRKKNETLNNSKSKTINESVSPEITVKTLEANPEITVTKTVGDDDINTPISVGYNINNTPAHKCW